MSAIADDYKSHSSMLLRLLATVPSRVAASERQSFRGRKGGTDGEHVILGGRAPEVANEDYNGLSTGKERAKWNACTILRDHRKRGSQHELGLGRKGPVVG